MKKKVEIYSLCHGGIALICILLLNVLVKQCVIKINQMPQNVGQKASISFP